MVRTWLQGLMLSSVVLFAGCGTFSDSLRREFASSHYDAVIERAGTWLQRHPVPADQQEAREQTLVQRLLAEAQVERAWTHGDAEELARLQVSFEGQPGLEDLRQRAHLSEATLRFNDEVLPATSSGSVRQLNEAASRQR